MKRKQPIRKVSKRQQERLKEYRKVRAAFLKQNPWCEVCKQLGVYEQSRELHHRFGKLGSLLTDVFGLLATCSFHHRYIHDNIEASRSAGWICEKGYWNNIKAIDKLKKLEHKS